MMWWFGPGGWWMALWMLLFWGGVILLVVWGVRALSDGGHGLRRGEDGSRALHILEERFARGEIDRDEFEQRRSTLEGR
jgi:putative membrane protein